MPRTASKLEAVLISRKVYVDGKVEWKKWIVNGPALNEEEKSFPMNQGVDKGASAKMIWE